MLNGRHMNDITIRK